MSTGAGSSARHFAGLIRSPPPVEPRRTDVVIALTLAMCATTVVVAEVNDGLERRVAAVVIGLLAVAVPIGVGLYARRREATRRFGALLIVTGFGVFMTTLANSGSELLFGIGRIAGWVMEVVIIYVVLAYPSGRLTTRPEWLVVGAGALLVGTLFIPTPLLGVEFPNPSPWSGCVTACPANGISLLGGEPASVDGLLVVRGALAIAVFSSAALVLAGRVARASPLARTSLTPVLAVAVVRFSAESAYLILRSAGASDAFLSTMALAVTATIPLMAVGFLVGILRWRLRTAHALELLAGGGQAVEGPASLQRLLAEALGDPSLRLYIRAPDGSSWIGTDGERAEAPPSGPGRLAVEVGGDAGARALVSVDDAIREQGALIEASSQAVRAALEHQRLSTALRLSLREAAASRARIAAAAVDERRRIERDLHDGIQQRLIALRITLGLAEEALRENPDHARTIIRELGTEIDAVIAEVRSLSRGIYPTVLTDAGPVDALRSLALNLPIEVEIHSEGVSRHQAQIESAVYFCCLEAIQNAIKHAGASAVRVEIAERDGLSFTVSDVGSGIGGQRGEGSGMTNMRDRLAAVGGSLTVSSRVGRGTTVAGRIPLSTQRSG